MNQQPEIMSTPETVISSDARIRFMQSMRDLWIYRDLFVAFVVRDLKVRYKQTALGVIWVVLQPLLAGGLFAFIFQSLGKREGGDMVGGLLFFMAALVPWTSFASAVQNAALSMESNAGMISKVYFPRMVIPGAYVCGSALDFLISFAAFIVIAIVAGKFSLFILGLMPLMLLIQMLAAMGIGLFFGALNAQYHDVKYVVPFLLQMGMFITVLIPLSDQPVWVQQVLSINPMAPVIHTFRNLLENKAVDMGLLIQAAGIAVAAFFIGVWFFRAREAKLVDIL